MGGKAPYDNSPRHKPASNGNPFTGHRSSGAPVPYWYVLGRMQFAPTLTADNGLHASAAPDGNPFTGHQPSGAPVLCWYVLGRMQFAPTLTADNGARPSGAPGRVYGKSQRFKGAAIYLQGDSKIVFNRSKRKTK